MKKIYLYIILAILVGLGLYFLGAELWQAVAGLFGLGAYGVIRENENIIKKSKEKADKAEQDYNDLKKENDKKIQEAGEDIEKEDINNHSDAADYIDDTLNDIS